VSLLHIANYGMIWVGLESTASAAITQGLSGTAGDHIVWIDFNHKVDIQVASVDTIRVHNGNNVTVAGNVTLVW
jgi:hypothetical protein